MSILASIQADSTRIQHIPELDATPSVEQIELFQRAGIGMARGLFAVDEIDHLREAFVNASADGPVPDLSETTEVALPKGRPDPLKRYPRMLHPHRRTDLAIGRLSLQYMLDKRLAVILRAVMREEPLAAQSMFYFKPPGARGQGLHQDNNPLSVKPGTCMAAWIPLDRCDADNGALSVVPGTGQLDLLCDAERDDRPDVFFNGQSLKLPDGVDPVTAAMEPGDVLFFNGQLIHGSFPNNTTDRWRRTLIFHYAPESCEEIADFYHPILDMAGSEVERRKSRMGGICGEFLELPDV